MNETNVESVSEGLQFWHEHLGRHLSDNPVERSSSAMVPTRLNRGVAPHRLGAKISAFYIVTPGHAWVIGKLALESNDKVTYIPSDGPEARRGDQFIAEWVCSDQFSTPCIIGVLGDVASESSFEISRSSRRVVFCQANKSFAFDAAHLRAAAAAIGQRSWWKEMRPALFQYFALQKARAGKVPHIIERENAKMIKLIQKSPDLPALLKLIDVREGSGEFRQLESLLSSRDDAPAQTGNQE